MQIPSGILLSTRPLIFSTASEPDSLAGGGRLTEFVAGREPAGGGAGGIPRGDGGVRADTAGGRRAGGALPPPRGHGVRAGLAEGGCGAGAGFLWGKLFFGSGVDGERAKR